MRIRVVREDGLRLNGQALAKGSETVVENGIGHDWVRQGWAEDIDAKAKQATPRSQKPK